MIGVKSLETKATDKKKSKHSRTGSNEKLINDTKSRKATKVAEKPTKKHVKNKKKKETKKGNKTHNKKSHVKASITALGQPKELIPEDIKIEKKHETITADSLPGAYGDDPTIGMKLKKFINVSCSLLSQNLLELYIHALSRYEDNSFLYG